MRRIASTFATRFFHSCAQLPRETGSLLRNMTFDVNGVSFPPELPPLSTRMHAFRFFMLLLFRCIYQIVTFPCRSAAPGSTLAWRFPLSAGTMKTITCERHLLTTLALSACSIIVSLAAPFPFLPTPRASYSINYMHAGNTKVARAASCLRLTLQ